MSKFVDVMVDLETVSLQPNAGIIALGACTVIPGEDGERTTFYMKIKFESLSPEFFHTDPTTMEWWAAQSKEAQAESFNGTSDVREVLLAFGFWLTSLGEVRLWGNGATFDNVVLGQAYKNLGIPLPWSYKNDMCYRTMKNLFPHVPAGEFVGIKHTALADAVHQANHLSRILWEIDYED